MFHLTESETEMHKSGLIKRLPNVVRHVGRLYNQSKFADAAHAYHRAAEAGGGYRQWCYTAVSASFVTDDDTALMAGRKCVEGGAGQKDSEGALAVAHRLIAGSLNRRGVYSEALAHSREALTLMPEDAWSYGEMADALYGLRRFEEVVTAAQQGDSPF
jgi:tetratricopeptide (TPR) repeat protein